MTKNQCHFQGDPNDKSHDSSFTGKSVDSNPSDEATAVKSLIAQLCEFFYRQGWASGTAGGCSIRIKGASNWRVFAAPSGIQKEDMIGEDVFELDMNGNIVQGPKTEGLKLSASTPLWFIVYKHRCVCYVELLEFFLLVMRTFPIFNLFILSSINLLDHQPNVSSILIP